MHCTFADLGSNKVSSSSSSSGKILKFADDTKLFRKVKEIGDKQNLQDDIDKLVKWSEKWQMFSASAGVKICLANLAKDQNFL